MKSIIPLTALAAFAVTGSAIAQTPAYSKPSGYFTETIKGDGAFNLIGLTLHQAPIATGSLTAVTSSKVTDVEVNFTTLLTAGSTYILQFKSGLQEGGIQVITNWGTASGNANGDLVVSDDVTALGVQQGVSYELRPAATISSIFGAANQAGLLSGSILSADVIWLPDGVGGFSKFYYSPASSFPVVIAAGWKNSSGGDAANTPIIYTDAIFIQRRGAGELELVLTGQVKTNKTQVFAAGSQFSYVSSVFPVGITLATSGLEVNLTSGSILTADVIWMQNVARTGYDKFYYSPSSSFPVVIAAGWKNSSGGDAGSQPLTSGIIIQRRGATDITAPITPPPSYSGL